MSRLRVWCYTWWPAMAGVYFWVAFLQAIGAAEQKRNVKRWLVG